MIARFHHTVPEPLDKPHDFDEYWNDVLTELERTPADVQATPDSLALAKSGGSGDDDAANSLWQDVSVTKLAFARLHGKRPTG